ncbi:hypothetical protein JAAARDRAFT_195017 [Jaapia argillacea MUCL 33604]|uniref:EF-hand domain-containing protein n=1 Tax=Jaapia argillacea MUCL 33604 TaxID=933084 RepID=A0A067PNJ1_9AGAM|nr:hypothetical protein JAAARDRAFT_195017 [Jaapia argillacea MUCL 33604]
MSQGHNPDTNDANLWPQVTTPPATNGSSQTSDAETVDLLVKAYTSPCISDAKDLVTALQEFDSQTKFINGCKELVAILDALSKIHPFVVVLVAVAVGFAIKLEVERRQNDERVLAVQLQMAGLAESLIVLRQLEDLSQKQDAYDGLYCRLKGFCDSMDKEVRKWTNVHDSYYHTMLLARWARSPHWAGQFRKFAKGFRDLQGELSRILDVNTQVALHQCNSNLKVALAQMRHLTDVTEKMFSDLRKEKEIKFSSYLEKGPPTGNVNKLDDEALKYFIEDNSISSSGDGSTMLNQAVLIRLFRDHAASEVGDIIEQHQAAFDEKFKAMSGDLKLDLRRAMENIKLEIIHAIEKGPYEPIRNEELQSIWKAQGWIGSTESVRCVEAIRRYCNLIEDSEDKGVFQMVGAQFQYLGGVWVQPLIEALDEDASGYISVAEVNAFTESMPSDWTLARWLAFWGFGSRMAVYHYARQIAHILTMLDFAIENQVASINRALIDRYLSPTVWYTDRILAGILSSPTPDEIDMTPVSNYFQEFLDQQMKKMKGRLEKFTFIDSSTTLAWIIGPGRLEANLMVILYLVLQRLIPIVQRASTETTDCSELRPIAISLFQIIDAVKARVSCLRGNPSLRRVDKHLSTFAFGMFQYIDDASAWELRSRDYYHNLRSLMSWEIEDLTKGESVVSTLTACLVPATGAHAQTRDSPPEINSLAVDDSLSSSLNNDENLSDSDGISLTLFNKFGAEIREIVALGGRHKDQEDGWAARLGVRFLTVTEENTLKELKEKLPQGQKRLVEFMLRRQVIHR